MWRVVRDIRGMTRPFFSVQAEDSCTAYQVVRDHFETFRAEAGRVHERDGLPRFIEEESRGFLRCGFLAGGFARFHSTRPAVPAAPSDRRSGASCHPSIDDEAPARLGPLAVARVFVRAVLGSLRRRARQNGVPWGRGWGRGSFWLGAAQPERARACVRARRGVCRRPVWDLRFHAAVPPADEEMDRLLGTIERRIDLLLTRRGVAEDVAEAGVDRSHEEAPVLAAVAEHPFRGDGRSVSALAPGWHVMVPGTRFRCPRRRGAGRVTRAGTATHRPDGESGPRRTSVTYSEMCGMVGCRECGRVSSLT